MRTIKDIAALKRVKPESIQKQIWRRFEIRLGLGEELPEDVKAFYENRRQGDKGGSLHDSLNLPTGDTGAASQVAAPNPVQSRVEEKPPTLLGYKRRSEGERSHQQSSSNSSQVKLNWFQRWAPIIPLPMLGVPASYGVYHFATLFAPWWVAVVEACAFEATYIGLAAANSLPKELRGQARRISLGAVGVSVLYNTIAGAVWRSPEMFERLKVSGEMWEFGLFWFLALAHGAPLAILAYLVSDLHINKKQGV